MEQLLQQNANDGLRVFVVWEPVLATDLAAPSTATLARISDPRASQYWDRRRLLSHQLGEHDRSSVVWDHIAVFPPGVLWRDSPPQPVYSAGPVVYVIGGAKDAVRHLAEGKK